MRGLMGLALLLCVAGAARAADTAPARELVRSAEAAARRGEARAALTLLDQAQAGLAPDAPPAERALVLERRGQALTELGRTDEAAPLLDQAATLARAAGGDALRGEALNDLGNALLNDDTARALAAYDEAASIAAAAGLHGLEARASVNAARAGLRRNDPAAAADRLARAERALAGTGGDAAALERLAVANVAVELSRQDPGRVETAYRAVRAAGEAAARGGSPRDLSWAAGLEGDLYAQGGRADEALALYRAAALRAEAARAPEVLFRWQWYAGRILARQGRRDEAIAAYRGAARNLDLVRLDLPAFDPRTGRSLFRETLGPVFVELADLLLRKADAEGRMGGGGGGGQVELVEARGTVERLKAVEIEDYFRADCTADLAARSRPIDRPGERTAVLYPILLEDRTELVLTLPDGRLVSAHAPARMGSAEVAEQASRLRRLLQIPAGRSYLEPARLLYDQLVRPVDALLREQKVETLVFVPDGPLRSVPLAALSDGEHFLVERYAVATGLGLGLLDARPLGDRRRLDMLVAGLTQGVRGFAPLPGVEREVREIAAIVPPRVVLKDQGFTTAAVERAVESRPFSVVHLASHGLFTGDPKNSFILTFDGRLDMDQLEALIRLGRDRDEPVELLTLSACETAAGDDRSALGLAGLAVKVGARSALASLWPIADESTVPLVTTFYRNLLQPGVNRAEALRRAQTKLLADPRFAKPFYWAPFLLIGSWE